MSDESYYQLAKVLDTIPNGFPSTESGVEIKLLKRIFQPEEADLFCDLRLTFETVEQIAERTSRPLDGLKEKLITMGEKGQIMAIEFHENNYFRMMPWVYGIFEFQAGRMDREFVELHEQYLDFPKQFFSATPQLLQTLPIEEEISTVQEALSYERVSDIVENSQSFLLLDCICKKSQGLIDNQCEKPMEVCMGFAPVPGVFDDIKIGRAITKEEAKATLKKAEEAGLVHMSNNLQAGRTFICNCCGCCCGALRSINELNLPASIVVNSHYNAVIDEKKCNACGTCVDDRCQVNAIEEGDPAYRVIEGRCIGCGLCVTTCPEEAIQLERKSENEIVAPPVDEPAWYKERGQQRGIDFLKYA
jgi:Na+-translocating ferredoxin:NAD+ oxidoreductase subunit B